VLEKVHVLSNTTAGGIEQKSFGSDVTPVSSIFSEVSFVSFDIFGMSPVTFGFLDKSKEVKAVNDVPINLGIASLSSHPRSESCCICVNVHNRGSTGAAVDDTNATPSQFILEMPQLMLLLVQALVHDTREELHGSSLFDAVRCARIPACVSYSMVHA
jgi:hypothetical protein